MNNANRFSKAKVEYSESILEVQKRTREAQIQRGEVKSKMATYCEKHDLSFAGGKCPECAGERGHTRSSDSGRDKTRNEKKPKPKPVPTFNEPPVGTQEETDTEGARKAQIIEEETAMPNPNTRLTRVTLEELLGHKGEFPTTPSQQQQVVEDPPTITPKSEQPVDPTDIEAIRRTFREGQAKTAARLAALMAEKERLEKMHDAVEETMKFLDEDLLPALEVARQQEDRETIREMSELLRITRLNPEVDKILTEREAEKRRDDEARQIEERRKRMEKENQLLERHLNTKMRPLVTVHGENPLHDAEEMLREDPSAEPILPPVVFTPGTVVIGPAGNNPVTTEILSEPGAVLLQLFSKEVYSNEGGERRTYFRVIAETKNLHYMEHAGLGGGENGVALCVTPYFIRRENDARLRDKFDSVKWGLRSLYSAEEDRMQRASARQYAISRMERERTEASIPLNDFLMMGAIGKTHVAGTFAVNDVERFLEVVLVRYANDMIENNPEGNKYNVELMAWGFNLEDRSHPSLHALARRENRDGKVINSVLMALEVKNLEIDKGTGAVNVMILPACLPVDDRIAREAKFQARTLGMLLKACMLAQMRAAAAQQEEPKQEISDEPVGKPVAEQVAVS